MSFEVQPSVSKNLCNCTLTSKGRSSSQSFLRSSSWVIILKFGLNKIFHFFINSKYTVTIPLITKMFSLSPSEFVHRFRELLHLIPNSWSLNDVHYPQKGLMLGFEFWNPIFSKP